MTGQTAKIAVLRECGESAVRHVNQYIGIDQLCRDAEFCCDSCGSYRCEYAGPGQPPDAEWREALLAANGAARLRLAGPAPGLVLALKVFREVSGVSLSQARRLVDQLSGDGVTGTLAEMEFLRTRLELRGIRADLGGW